MRYDDFVAAVKAAGWRDTADAQHDGIRKLWEELFPTVVELGQTLRDKGAMKTAAEDKTELLCWVSEATYKALLAGEGLIASMTPKGPLGPIAKSDIPLYTSLEGKSNDK